MRGSAATAACSAANHPSVQSLKQTGRQGTHVKRQPDEKREEVAREEREVVVCRRRHAVENRRKRVQNVPVVTESVCTLLSSGIEQRTHMAVVYASNRPTVVPFHVALSMSACSLLAAWIAVIVIRKANEEKGKEELTADQEGPKAELSNDFV